MTPNTLSHLVDARLQIVACPMFVQPFRTRPIPWVRLFLNRSLFFLVLGTTRLLRTRLPDAMDRSDFWPDWFRLTVRTRFFLLSLLCVWTRLLRTRFAGWESV